MKTTQARRDELRKMEQKTTPGIRWDVTHGAYSTPANLFSVVAPNDIGSIIAEFSPHVTLGDCFLHNRDAELCAAARNSLADLLDDVEELRRLLRRASGELHVVGSYRDNAETAGLYITAKAQYDLAVEIDAALAEKEHS